MLKELAEEWNVLVYAHPIELLPYVTGQQEYLPPDPTVDGGIMPWMSPLFPRGPIDLGARAAALPLDNSLPDLAGLALDSYSRPFTGTRVVLSLGGQGVASGRCVLHHKPAIVSCGRHAKA